MNVLKIQKTITSGNTDSKQKQKRKKEWKKRVQPLHEELNHFSQ